uniref:Uncharacterized protein n=1 Tax=Tanacetum cinerariifolium TaxID=118510 RepID=A0A6L2NYK5_TANCI|nr:hypothetical protein [Tanacetum cinerariifolium]
MGESLSPDRVFDFSMDEPEPQDAYDFFAPGLLPGYVGAEVDEPMIGSMIDELAKQIVEAEEQMIALVMDMEEDLAVLFGDDDYIDDDFEGPEGDEKVWEVNEEWLMAPVTPPLMLVMPPPSTYEVGGSSTAATKGHSLTLLEPGVSEPPSVIEDLCTRMGNLEHGHGLLVKKVIMVSDVEVADSIAIREIGPRVSTMESQIQVMASQMVQVVSRLEQVGAHVKQGQQAATQRDETIAGLSN